MTKTLIETQDLSIGYHSRKPAPPVAGGLNLRLCSGKLTCLVGSNGTGKSTLLRTLAGLQKPRGGRILLDGRPYAQYTPDELARCISIVLTHAAHPGDLRVEQVVELGRLPYTNWLGALTERDHLAVRHALERLNALSLADRSFGELSDGERQKVMVARALAQEPRVMILDEPTAFLDWPNRVDLLTVLSRIAVEEDRAILLSSHDLELVLRIAGELWVIDDRRSVVCGSRQALLENGVLDRAFAGRYGSFEVK